MSRRTPAIRLYVLIGLVAIAVFLFFRNFKTRPELPSGEKIVSDFHRLYHTGRAVHQKTLWLGIKIQQTPCDMWTIQEIIYEQKPDFVIETGTLKGRSALYFATLFHSFLDSGRVITVNLEKEVDAAERIPIFQEHVIQVIGDSVAAETIKRISDIIEGRRALVMLDSDHHKEHVLKEMRLYSQFVPLGGYLIVNDTNFNGNPVMPDFGPGPMEAVEEFMRTDDRFLIDRGREKFLLTYYPRGYLKRVK